MLKTHLRSLLLYLSSDVWFIVVIVILLASAVVTYCCKRAHPSRQSVAAVDATTVATVPSATATTTFPMYPVSFRIYLQNIYDVFVVFAHQYPNTFKISKIEYKLNSFVGYNLLSNGVGGGVEKGAIIPPNFFLEVIPKEGLLEKMFAQKVAQNSFGKVWENSRKSHSHPEKFACSYTYAPESRS